MHVGLHLDYQSTSHYATNDRNAFATLETLFHVAKTIMNHRCIVMISVQVQKKPQAEQTKANIRLIASQWGNVYVFM